MNVRSRRWALLASLALVVGFPVPASADDDVVDVTAVVRGEDGPTDVLADVTVHVWQWVGGDDNDWAPVLSEASSDVDGRFTLTLAAGTAYTLAFDAPDSTYPLQYLGGGPERPESPNAVDWPIATFVAGPDSLPSPITLHREARLSGTGIVTGDEEGAVVAGWVDLVEVVDGAVPGEESVGNLPLEPDGTFTFHGLRAGQRYTIRVLADSYLPTYLGDTSQPEMADTFVVGSSHVAIETIELQRAASLTGTITSGGSPVDLAHVTALRWDPVGERWLTPTHYDGTPTDTAPDGSWHLTLEPEVRYTLFVDTSDAESPSGQLPVSHYLGGETSPPAPDDPTATFELLPSGDHKDWDLIAPRIGALAAPTVTGAPRIGERLTSSTGSWAVSGVSHSRQWLRGGSPIPGATSESYAPTADDVGKRLAVRVTASHPGYSASSSVSASTAPVTKAITTTRLSLSRSSSKFGAKVIANVTVNASAGTPDGAVTLTIDGKSFESKRPTVRGTSATARFVLPRNLRTGTHRLVASVAHSTTVGGSTSATQTLRTKKAKAKVTVKGPKKWRIAKGKRPRLTITVKGTKGGAKPTGKVVVKIGKKKYTKTLKAGKVKIRGAKLRKTGRVKIKVTYRPTAKTYSKPKVVRKTLRVR